MVHFSWEYYEKYQVLEYNFSNASNVLSLIVDFNFVSGRYKIDVVPLCLPSEIKVKIL